MFVDYQVFMMVTLFNPEQRTLLTRYCMSNTIIELESSLISLSQLSRRAFGHFQVSVLHFLSVDSLLLFLHPEVFLFVFVSLDLVETFVCQPHRKLLF